MKIETTITFDEFEKELIEKVAAREGMGIGNLLKRPSEEVDPGVTVEEGPPADPPPAATPSPADPPPAAPPATGGAGPELDAQGIPWDGRIHSSSRKKLAKTGKWKTKRGVSPTLVQTVIKEYLDKLPLTPSPDETDAPAPPPTQGAAPPPTLVAVTFPELMSKIVQKQLTLEQMNAIAADYDLASMAHANAHPDKCAQIAADPRVA